MTELDYLVADTIKWARDKGISDVPKQLLKCHEELAEAWTAIYRDYNNEEIKTELGDVLVTAIILVDILGYEVEDCLGLAYDKISKRRGKAINGCFIKEKGES